MREMREHLCARRLALAECYLVLRFAVAVLRLRLCGWVRLLSPAVALREPLAKAILTSSRSGARSATTRIPWELVLSSGLVIPLVYALRADV